MLCAVIAAAGVIALMRPQPTAAYVGMGLALVAAACWAWYILLNRTVGRRIPGSRGSAAAAGLSALTFLPAGLAVVRHPPSLGAVACAVVAGILPSAVPFLADLFPLRPVPAQAFGLFHECQPRAGGWSAGSPSARTWGGPRGPVLGRLLPPTSEHPHVAVAAPGRGCETAAGPLPALRQATSYARKAGEAGACAGRGQLRPSAGNPPEGPVSCRRHSGGNPGPLRHGGGQPRQGGGGLLIRVGVVRGRSRR